MLVWELDTYPHIFTHHIWQTPIQWRKYKSRCNTRHNSNWFFPWLGISQRPLTRYPIKQHIDTVTPHETMTHFDM